MNNFILEENAAKLTSVETGTVFCSHKRNAHQKQSNVNSLLFAWLFSSQMKCK